MEVTTPFGMVGGLGALPPAVEKKASPCELEELLTKIANLYPSLTQEKENLLVNLSGDLPHVGLIRVQTEGKRELEEALNHLFLANTVACHFKQKKEFQVKAFVWTPKAKSLTLAYKGIAAAINIQGYLAEGSVKLSHLIEQFKTVWEEAKLAKDARLGYSAPWTCKHSFQREAPLQEHVLPKGLLAQLHCKC